MLKEYDFSNARKNPYAKALKKQITINIDSNTIDYFKEQAEVVGIPYQTLINLYLKDCVTNNRHLSPSGFAPDGLFVCNFPIKDAKKAVMWYNKR